MEKSDQGGRGRVVLATVKGDVHDIGKNLVDIILTNNGYEVDQPRHQGRRQRDAERRRGAPGRRPRHERTAREVDAHHAREPRDHERARRCPASPVLLGGAALTRTYVERDLREIYDGRLFYGKDAFEGLRVLDRLGELRRSGRGRPHLRPRGLRQARSSAASARVAPTVDPTASLDAAPRSRPTIRSSPRRSSAAGWRRASRSTRSAST